MKELLDRAEMTVWRESKSQATVRSNVKILTGLIGQETVDEMTYTRLERLVEELRTLGYAPGTIKRKLDAVSKVLRMATKWTDAEGRPLLASKPTMPRIKVDNLKDRVLSFAEEEAVFAAIEKRRQEEPQRQWRRYADLVRFLLDTGARLGEALGIGPDDISSVPTLSGPVRLVTFGRYRTKNDKPRSVPLTKSADAALERRAEDLGRRRGEDKFLYFPLNEGTAWYMWSNIRDDLAALGMDIADVTLHTLRHTCLTRLAQGGMELLRLQKWAGHSDPKITAERYVHLRVDDLVSGVDILQGSNGGTPAIVTIMTPPANRAGSGALSLN
jgi:integrase